MTKGKPCPALIALIDTNTIDIEANKWVERDLSKVLAIARGSAKWLDPWGENEKGLDRLKTL
jgi:hypothetical protein